MDLKKHGWTSVSKILPYRDNKALLIGFDYDSIFLLDNKGNENLLGYYELGKYKMNLRMSLPDNLEGKQTPYSNLQPTHSNPNQFWKLNKPIIFS